MRSTHLLLVLCGLVVFTGCEAPTKERFTDREDPSQVANPDASDPAQDTAPPPRTTQDLKVMTYNTWGLPAPILRDKSRFPDIARFLPLLNAEIVTFQETFTSSAEVLAKLPAYPYVAWGPGKKFLKLSSGLLTVSKYPIVATDMMTYSKCSGLDCIARKGALYTQIKVPGLGLIDVINTHLNANVGDKLLLIQIEELAHFVEAHRGDHPLLMMGDFNLVPHSAPYERFIKILDIQDSHENFVATHSGLSDLAHDAYTADPRLNTQLKHSKRGPKKLDYIWYLASPDQPVEVLQSMVGMDAPVSGRNLSDHFSLVVTLQVDVPESATKQDEENESVLNQELAALAL